MIPDIHFVLSIRLNPGFRDVRVTGSGRLAFVTKAEGDEANIDVTQPSDCMALQRQHVVCSEVDSIDVWFGYSLTSRINGPKHPESPEVWQTAVHHLLNTYQPRLCYIHTGGTETGLPDEVRMEVDDKICYRGFWDDKERVLSLRRCVFSNLRAIKVSRIIGDHVAFNFCDHFLLTDKNSVSTCSDI